MANRSTGRVICKGYGIRAKGHGLGTYLLNNPNKVSRPTVPPQEPWSDRKKFWITILYVVGVPVGAYLVYPFVT